tara:strand:- start:261 stop:878 length:618 start_codon:yes stop_codon:yes gene_type:complete
MRGLINLLFSGNKVSKRIKDIEKANKTLKLYRAENYPGQRPFLRPDTDPKKEFVGRWFTTNKDFVDKFATNTPHTKAIKTLTVNPPIKSSPDKVSKTINELMEDQKILKEWTPNLGMGSNLSQIKPYYSGKGRDKYMPKLEFFLNNPDLRKLITLTPPKDIAATSKIDIWLSLLAILKNKNPQMFKEILTLIKAKRMGLKTGGIV